MENRFTEKMIQKSDDDLRDYVINKQRYEAEAAAAAIEELIKRGKSPSDEEITNIENHFSIIEKKQEKSRWIFGKEYWNQNIVEDESAPILYSRLAIYMLCTLASTLFGSVLLALNLRMLNKNKESIYAILFGIAFTVISIYFTSITVNYIKGTTLNMFGGWILIGFLWKQLVGVDTKYRKRKITVPVLIAILLNVFVILNLNNG